MSSKSCSHAVFYNLFIHVAPIGLGIITKTLVAILMVASIVAAAGGAYFLLSGSWGARVAPGQSDTITASATDEVGAKSSAETQFREDFPAVPLSAPISVQLEDASSEYWKATASYEDDSKTYWVPKEKPLALRMAVGQSQTYSIEMTMPGLAENLGGSGSMSITGTFSYAVAEQTTYEGMQVYKVTMSGSMSMMGMSVPYNGYLYVDTGSYETRYMNISYSASMLGQTMSATIEYFFNYENDTLRMKMTMNGETYMDTETDLPDSTFSQYSMQGFLDENLYVGWTDNLVFQSDNTSYTVTLTVTKEETITVPAGTFRCYVLSMSVPESDNMFGTSITGNVWVNAQMTLMPKMEISATYGGQTLMDMKMTLQSYSGY